MGWLSYLLKKIGDLGRMGRRDLRLADLVVRIHAERTGVELRRISLRRLRQIHPLDRPEAAETLQGRIRRLEEGKRAMLEKGLVTQEDLARLVPSVSWIKVVPAGRGDYIAFEGNGRLAALRAALGDADVAVEAEVYHVPERLSRAAAGLRRSFRLAD